MIDLELGPLDRRDIPEAAALAARAMADAPSSIVMFGDDPQWRIRMLAPVFELLLRADPTLPLAAHRAGVLVGFGAMSDPGECLSRQMERRGKSIQIGGKRVSVSAPSVPWRLVPAFLRMGPGALARVSAIGSQLALHDLPERHAHLQLLAVEPAVQGLGVGTRIMRELASRVEARAELMALETDKERNVGYYEGFGFDVREAREIAGVRYWFMVRKRAAE